MRQAALIALLVLVCATDALAQDKFLISKGALVSVYQSRRDAQDNYSDSNAKPKVFLPAGSLLMKIDDNLLAQRTITNHLVLTETGLWGISNLSPHDFYDEKWRKNLHALLLEQGQNYQKNCPNSMGANFLRLLFPVRTTTGQRHHRGTTVPTTFYPGDLLYSFSLEDSDNGIVGHQPLTCAKVELPMQDVNDLELLNFSFGVRKKEELRNQFIRRVRVSNGAAEKRYRCGVKTKVTISEMEAEEITEALSASLGLEYASIYSRSEVQLDEKRLSSKLQSQEREFPGNFSIHRVFYLQGDGSKLEVLENWRKCSGTSDESGEADARYHVYLAEGAQELVLDKASAEKIGIEVTAPTGTWILRSERGYWAVRDFLQRDHHLNSHTVHFLMRSMMDWRE